MMAAIIMRLYPWHEIKFDLNLILRFFLDILLVWNNASFLAYSIHKEFV